MKKNKVFIIQSLVYVVIACLCVSIGFTSLWKGTTSIRLAKIRSSLHDVNEVYLVNQTYQFPEDNRLPGYGFLLNSLNRAFSQEEIKQIQSLDCVEKLYPDYQLYANTEENYKEEFYNIKVDGNTYLESFFIKSYFDFQNVKAKCSYLTGNEDGIYISQSIANQIGLAPNKDTSMELNGFAHISNVDDPNNDTSYPLTLSLPVAGILDKNYGELYGTNIILIPYETMENTLKQLNQEGLLKSVIYRVQLKKGTSLDTFKTKVQEIVSTAKVASDYQYYQDVGNYYFKDNMKLVLPTLILSLVGFIISNVVYYRLIKKTHLPRKTLAFMFISFIALEVIISLTFYNSLCNLIIDASLLEPIMDYYLPMNYGQASLYLITILGVFYGLTYLRLLKESK